MTTKTPRTGRSKPTKHKRIGIFFDEPGFDDYPFTDKDFRTAYDEFVALLAEKGADVWIVRNQSTYIDDNRFTKGWRYEKGSFTKDSGPIELDVIFNKGHLLADPDANLINETGLENFCTDKWKSSLVFPHLFPNSLLVTNEKELKAALATFPDMVTVKPVDGWRGLDVRIGKAKEIAKADIAFPCLVQDFIDTSNGIPGVTEGLHDLRLIGVTNKLVYAYVRVPPPKSFVSNYAQGGSWFEVPLDKLPKGAVKVFKEVDVFMKKFPNRIYSVDVGLDKDGSWKIFELNSKPSLDPRSSYPGAARFMDAVIEVLMMA